MTENNKFGSVSLLILKSIFLRMSPIFLLGTLHIAKGIFVWSDKNVLAYNGTGLYPYLFLHVLLLIVVNIIAQNWSQKKKLSKAKREKRERTAESVYLCVGAVALTLMLISFFPRQVLYADRIDTFDEANRLVESLSLEGAMIPAIEFEERKARYSSKYYKLIATVEAGGRSIEFEIKTKHLRKLCDSFYKDETPNVVVKGECFYDDYLKTHKDLTEADREFLSSIVAR